MKTFADKIIAFNRSLDFKITLSVFFFMCLIKMPYGYYEFVRFIVLIVFVFLAFDANQLKRPIGMFIYIALAILFQPFFKIALGRELWNIVDLIVGIGLMASVLIRQQNIESK